MYCHWRMTLPLPLPTAQGFSRVHRLGLTEAPAHTVEGVGGEFLRLGRIPTSRAALPDLCGCRDKTNNIQQLTNQPL